MKRLIALFLALATCSFGAINAVNGVAVTTSSNINGVTTPSAVNGQTINAAVTFSDNFNRPNENPLTGGWTNGATGYNGLKVLNNEAVAITDSSNSCAYVTTPDFTPYPNQSATATMGSSTSFGVFVRLSAGGNGYRLIMVNSTTMRVAVINAGTASTLGADFTIAALTAGQSITLGITGTTLTVYVNGVSQGTRTDSTHSTGSPGLYAFSAFGGATSFSCTSL